MFISKHFCVRLRFELESTSQTGFNLNLCLMENNFKFQVSGVSIEAIKALKRLWYCGVAWICVCTMKYSLTEHCLLYIKHKIS